MRNVERDSRSQRGPRMCRLIVVELVETLTRGEERFRALLRASCSQRTAGRERFTAALRGGILSYIAINRRGEHRLRVHRLATNLLAKSLTIFRIN